MANYCGVTRTNYFHVKDEIAFKEFMRSVFADEDSIGVWEEKDKNGNTVFGFGCYGSILGVKPEGVKDNDDFDYDYDGFVNGLSACVADDDAVIVLESGNEKLRYIVGGALIVTSEASKYCDINEIAQMEASKMLHDPFWSTQTMY